MFSVHAVPMLHDVPTNTIWNLALSMALRQLELRGFLVRFCVEHQAVVSYPPSGRFVPVMPHSECAVIDFFQYYGGIRVGYYVHSTAMWLKATGIVDALVQLGASRELFEMPTM